MVKANTKDKLNGKTLKLATKSKAIKKVPKSKVRLTKDDLV